MSLDWKLHRGLGNRPYNLMLFLAISLLLHGAVFLGLEIYWRRSVNHALQTEPDKMIPVQFIQVPPDRVAVKPPPDAKLRASSNSRAGGKARPELPLSTGALAAKPTTRLPSSPPKLTQPKPKSSTAQPSEPEEPPQEQPAPRRVRQPVTRSKTNNSSPVARTRPKLTSSSRQPPRQNSSLIGDPAKLASDDLMRERRDNLPNPNRQVPESKTNNTPVARTRPKLTSSSRQSPAQGASLLGGPVRLASHQFGGDNRDNLPNSNRLATGPQGVDAREDVDLGPYLDALRREVAQQWRPQGSRASEQTTIGFSVSRSGQVRDLRVLQTSGSTLTDQAALQAVRRAAPFPPLPDGYRAGQLDIHFKFNINVYGVQSFSP